MIHLEKFVPRRFILWLESDASLCIGPPGDTVVSARSPVPANRGVRPDCARAMAYALRSRVADSTTLRKDSGAPLSLQSCETPVPNAATAPVLHTVVHPKEKPGMCTALHRRDRHNQTERQRVERLNGLFQQLFDALHEEDDVIQSCTSAADDLEAALPHSNDMADKTISKAGVLAAAVDLIYNLRTAIAVERGRHEAEEVLRSSGCSFGNVLQACRMTASQSLISPETRAFGLVYSF